MENTLQLVRHFSKATPLEKSKRLGEYINRETGYLNTAKYKVMLTTLMRNEPFFKRYDLPTLSKFLGYGKPAYFKKDEILFLDGRVGVVTHGSVRIKHHAENLLDPITLAKYGTGKILGHDSDGGITTNSQSWIICFEDATEILFFDRSVFNKLWKIQFLRTDRQIIEANIECN